MEPDPNVDIVQRKCTSVATASFTISLESVPEPYIPHVDSRAYTYELPPERIAQHPLPVRDESKLLVADARTHTISHHKFYELPALLPEGSFLVRNTTRVLPARIVARKPSGGHVELLLIAPSDGTAPAEALMQSKSTWKCMIGGRRIRAGMTIEVLSNDRGITARILDVAEMLATVELTAQPETSSIAEQLLHLGNVPLPPYIRREPTAEDLERYQTIYAQIEGSVAAPTAGLHFTERVLDALSRNGVEILDVVLHVGPGTFQPLRSENAAQHTMHAERILVERSTIARLRELVAERNRFCVCVGTTSVRTVESLYWFGARLVVDPSVPPQHLKQQEPYLPKLLERTIPAEHALDALLDWLDRSGVSTLEASTQLYILPGYRSRIVEGMITNFHQPQSTLLLLVAAFIGPWWQTIYHEALSNNYRFLSYGDASLLIAPRTTAASR